MARTYTDLQVLMSLVAHKTPDPIHRGKPAVTAVVSILSLLSRNESTILSDDVFDAIASAYSDGNVWSFE